VKCPKCSGKLKPFEAFTPQGAIELDRCAECDGIWFDDMEASAYFDMAQDLPEFREALASSTVTELACPRCTSNAFKLDEVRFVRTHNVLLDFCRQCGGLFFDAGEVEQVAEIARALPAATSRVLSAFSTADWTTRRS